MSVNKKEVRNTSKTRQIVVSVVILLYVVFFFFLVQKNMHLFQYFTMGKSFGIISITISAVAAIGMINYVLFHAVIQNLRPKDGLKLAVVNTLGNYLPLSAGLIGKGIYLKKSFGLKYTEYASLMFSALILRISLSGFLGLAALSRLKIGDVELVVLFVCLALSASLFVLPYRPFFKNRLGEILKKISWGQKLIRRSFGSLSLWVTVLLCLQALVLALSFRAIGHECSYWHAMLYSSGIVLTRFLNFLPGAIGVREGIVIALGMYTGLGVTEAILGVGIARLAGVVVVFVWGILLYKDDLKKILKPA